MICHLRFGVFQICEFYVCDKNAKQKCILKSFYILTIFSFFFRRGQKCHKCHKCPWRLRFRGFKIAQKLHKSVTNTPKVSQNFNSKCHIFRSDTNPSVEQVQFVPCQFSLFLTEKHFHYRSDHRSGSQKSTG